MGARLPEFDDLSQIAARAARYRSHPLSSVLCEVGDESMRESTKAQLRMSSRDFGNGLKECAVWLYRPDPDKTLQRAISRDLRIVVERGDGDREASIRASCRRAKQKVRHLCKAMAVNSLWTLTIRENMQDREVMLKYIDRFRRRVVKVLGEWRYVAVIEPQERGALHVHLATHALALRIERGGVKVKSWDVMRAIWRSVLAVDGLTGNFDEAKRKKRWGGSEPIKGSGAIASYIAGYVAKDMANSELNRKRYSVSKGVELPDAVRSVFGAERGMAALIELAFAAVGERITRAWFCKDTQVFYVESDDSAREPVR